MKAKKMVKKTRKGEYEIIKNHVKKCPLSKNLFVEICNNMDFFDMDGYDAYFQGICFDVDGDLAFIDVDKFIKTVNNYIKKMHEDGEETEEESGLVDSLQEYSGYTLYL